MPYTPDYGAMGQMGMGLLRPPGQAPDPTQQALGGFLQQQRRQRPGMGMGGMGGTGMAPPGAEQQPMSLLDMLPGLARRHPLGGLGGGGFGGGGVA